MRFFCSKVIAFHVLELFKSKGKVLDMCFEFDIRHELRELTPSKRFHVKHLRIVLFRDNAAVIVAIVVGTVLPLLVLWDDDCSSFSWFIFVFRLGCCVIWSVGRRGGCSSRWRGD